MRMAVIADLHGNLTALEVVLGDLAAAGVEQCVCLGDVALGGPQPREVVARLREMGCPTVLGNTDAAAARPFHIVSAEDEEGQRWQEIDSWGAAQLPVEDRSFLGALPPTLTQPLGEDATVLCFHGSPYSNTDRITATTPDAALARMLSSCTDTVLAGGHTHLPFIRRYGASLLLNPGSVGLPYATRDGGPLHPPWAEYGIIEWGAGGLSIELRRVPIDVDRIIAAVLHSGMPHSEWLAGCWR